MGSTPLFDDVSYVVVNLARMIRPGEIVFTGVNSAVPVAACLLAKRCYDLPFTHLNVAGGIDARPERLPASSGDPSLLTGTAAIFNNEDFYDLCLRGRLDVVFLGAAQIDRDGRANVSAIGSWASPKVRLPGGGGAAVMMPTARRAILWQTTHSTRGLVERVDFATAAGATAVVTPIAVFARSRNEPFALVEYREDVSLAEIRGRTGFSFAADAAAVSARPTATELDNLRQLDANSVLRRLFGRPRAFASPGTR